MAIKKESARFRAVVGVLCFLVVSTGFADTSPGRDAPAESDAKAIVKRVHPLILRLHERVPVEDLASTVTDVHSTQYGKTYSNEEIRAVSGPPDSDYNALLQGLRDKGFLITRESPTHLWVEILPSNFSSNSWESSLANKLREEFALVESVIGQDHSRQAEPLRARAKSVFAPPALPIQFGPLGPSWIRSAYGFDPIYAKGITGRNQMIAIVSYGGFYRSDVDEYFSARKISPAPTVEEIEINGDVSVTRESMGETAMDAEFAGMIAPGSHILVFESSHNDDAGDVELFNAILDDGRAKIVSYSWGNCETAVSRQHLLDMNKVFARAVAQGVNILVGSGDFGAEGCPGDTGITADWPASSPYVVAVGGTSIQGRDERGEVQESAWADSGGGMSGVFEKPSWQSEISFERRAFPDVAFNADGTSGEPAWVHRSFGESGDGNAEWVTMGGTSIAAPQWAGFLALVGEARNGKSPLGYLNPKIYGLRKDLRASLFHDITVGGNNGYLAGLGWDAVTGWGSMKAFPLLDYLKGL